MLAVIIQFKLSMKCMQCTVNTVTSLYSLHATALYLLTSKNFQHHFKEYNKDWGILVTMHQLC